VALAAVVLGIAISLVPGLGQRAEYAADRFRDRAGYAARVLRGHPIEPAPNLPVTILHTSLESVLYGGGATLVAVGLAFVGLYRRRLPRVLSVVGTRTLAPPIRILRELHSGVVGDYVTWVAVGTAVLGGVWALLLHG
jgi:multicomponent Na+:H+ antiporter subunit D